MTIDLTLPTPSELGTVLGVVFAIAKLITILMPTPPPGSKWAKPYRAVEVVALLIGRAKETGVLPKTTLDRFAGDAVEALKTMPRTGS
jgi:hypothetical protein